eukprot:1902085-Amphidinium_carterae.1
MGQLETSGCELGQMRQGDGSWCCQQAVLRKQHNAPRHPPMKNISSVYKCSASSDEATSHLQFDVTRELNRHHPRLYT